MLLYIEVESLVQEAHHNSYNYSGVLHCITGSIEEKTKMHYGVNNISLLVDYGALSYP